MSTVRDLVNFFEEIAPARLQESYDNSGLILGDPEMEIKGVLCCLDSTEAIVEEAIEKNCNVIVAHHPIVFSGLKRLTGSSYIERTVIKAIRAGIAVYAIHTNLDNVLHKGVNERIAKKLGLQNIKILQIREGENNIGAGLIGEIPEAVSAVDFLAKIKSSMRTACVRYTRLGDKPVKKVAVCGGSGSFLLAEAIAQGADIFVSADFKYHQFFDAEDKIIIADVGHYESEQFTIDLLFELIQNNFRNFAAHCTNLNTNPIKYLV